MEKAVEVWLALPHGATADLHLWMEFRLATQGLEAMLSGEKTEHITFGRSVKDAIFAQRRRPP